MIEIEAKGWAMGMSHGWGGLERGEIVMGGCWGWASECAIREGTGPGGGGGGGWDGGAGGG